MLVQSARASWGVRHSVGAKPVDTWHLPRRPKGPSANDEDLVFFEHLAELRAASQVFQVGITPQCVVVGKPLGERGVDLIERKAAGEQFEAPTAVAAAPQVIDLMAALEASVAAARAARSA